MAGAESYSSKQWVVPANTVLNIDAVGSFIGCLASNLASFLIGIDGGPPQFMAQGITLATVDRESFSSFTIDNSANASPLTVRLAWGTGRMRDARLSLTGAINIAKASVLLTVADVAVTAGAEDVLLPANANRREAFLSNLDAAIDLRIGDTTNVSASRGFVLKAGQSVIIETTEEISAHNAGGTDVDVAIGWTED